MLIVTSSLCKLYVKILLSISHKNHNYNVLYYNILHIDIFTLHYYAKYKELNKKNIIV